MFTRAAMWAAVGVLVAVGTAGAQPTTGTTKTGTKPTIGGVSGGTTGTTGTVTQPSTGGTFSGGTAGTAGGFGGRRSMTLGRQADVQAMLEALLMVEMYLQANDVQSLNEFDLLLLFLEAYELRYRAALLQQAAGGGLGGGMSSTGTTGP